MGPYQQLGNLGAIVAKSHSVDSWPGNPAPRMFEATGGMLNSVGLQNKGIKYWLANELPKLEAARATVVASIWGTSMEDYVLATKELTGASTAIAAVEVNLSCPNLHRGRGMFAQSATDSAELIASVVSECDRPVWAKLSAAVTDLTEVANAVAEAGADAVTLINTIPGMAIDIERHSPVLGGVSGGLSGPAIHPVAVKAVFDVRAANPHLPIVGVGGVSKVADAIELMMAGASAIQVGTALFEDPRACQRIQDGIAAWCLSHGVTRVADIVGAAHG